MGGEMFSILCAWMLGVALSLGMERLLTPPPALRRLPVAWCAHAALWSLAYMVLLVALGRPWCAMLFVSAILAVLVLVSNAKFKSMREPFLAQDYDYFVDALRYPRLFLPFLGIRAFTLAALCVLLAAGAIYLEPPLPARFALRGPLGLALGVASIAILWLWHLGGGLPVSFVPAEDLSALGFLPYLWTYTTRQRTRPVPVSPLGSVALGPREALPHMVAIQSESFFDARDLYHGVRRDVLRNFDSMCAEAWQYGSMAVPAWGANTERTEYAFLTGMSPEQLGMHRFNPYRLVTAGWPVTALPMLLKKLGYRTIALHPHHGAFYGRDYLFRQFGFDEFLDIRAFKGAIHVGAYVADAEVGKKIMAILGDAAEPTFVFAITMENHGPLRLERVMPADVERLYTTPPPPGCDDLTVYLRHLRNADAMLGALRAFCLHCCRPATLCVYGDHVPIMPQVYAELGMPAGAVPYVLWDSQFVRCVSAGKPQKLAAHDLPVAWLGMAAADCVHPAATHGDTLQQWGRQA